jgi:hypothetical protein
VRPQPRQSVSIIASTAMRGLTLASIAVRHSSTASSLRRRRLRRPALGGGARLVGQVGVHRADVRESVRASTSR